MLSSIRSAVKQTSRRAGGSYSGYATPSQTFNPLTTLKPVASASAEGLFNELDLPPSAEGGYSRALPPSSTSQSSGEGAIHLPPARIPQYKLHCFSSRNNTITTFTDPTGNPIAWYSGGSCGFKRGQRASYEAGYQCAVKIFRRIEDTAASKGMVRIALFFNGFGQGREAMQKALMTSEGGNVKGLVEVVGDRTPIKIGGTRSKKMRRL
ncbi:mitochondrial ribosomal protein subunit S18 [Lentinula aciculospora]|uniref:Mitochondrial ribosomal protein subunit S18 n=1 Tax=Lentinula aciculospora TaxID=153920 RepID=A0A9W9A1H4_9AGAR|nr:mitochondrial ribosomal protein subunit S18 [Lentinula aciculospora]